MMNRSSESTAKSGNGPERKGYTGRKKVRRLQAGVRVRVKPEANTPYAGRQGVVLFAGDTVCDVKFLPRHRGNKRSSRRTEIDYDEADSGRIESVPREWLESTRAGVDLIALFPQRQKFAHFWHGSSSPDRKRGRRRLSAEHARVLSRRGLWLMIGAVGTVTVVVVIVLLVAR